MCNILFFSNSILVLYDHLILLDKRSLHENTLVEECVRSLRNAKKKQSLLQSNGAKHIVSWYWMFILQSFYTIYTVYLSYLFYSSRIKNTLYYIYIEFNIYIYIYIYYWTGTMRGVTCALITTLLWALTASQTQSKWDTTPSPPPHPRPS